MAKSASSKGRFTVSIAYYQNDKATQIGSAVVLAQITGLPTTYAEYGAMVTPPAGTAYAQITCVLDTKADTVSIDEVRAGRATRAADITSVAATTTAVSRPLSGKLFERNVSVLDFGAVADCTGFGAGTDNLAAFNAAIAYAKSVGAGLYIPSGQFRLTGSPTIDFSGATTDTSARMVIRGEGSTHTRLVFDNGNLNGLTIKGGSGAAFSSRVQVEGIRLSKADNTGTGLSLNAMAYCLYRDLVIEGWSYGVSGVDTLSSVWDRCFFASNKYGVSLAFGSLSRPNAIVFMGCIWGSNLNAGLVLNNPVAIAVLGGTFESNGVGGSDATRYALGVIGGPVDGTESLLVEGAYFEHTSGNADIYLSNSDAPSSYTVKGCTFNRTDSAYYVTNNIYMAGSVVMRLVLIGNGFKSFGTYASGAASSSRPYISTGAAGNAEVHDIGNTKGSTAEDIPPNGLAISNRTVPRTVVRFSGSTSGITLGTNNLNVSGVARNGVGDYSISFNQQSPTSGNVYTFTSNAGPVSITSEATGSVRIQLYSPTGSPVDGLVTGTILFPNS